MIGTKFLATWCSKENSGTGSAASNSAIRIEDDELAHVMELLNDGDGQSGGSNEQWEAVIDKQSDAVAYTAKRRDPKVCTDINLKGPIYTRSPFRQLMIWFYFWGIRPQPLYFTQLQYEL